VALAALAERCGAEAADLGTTADDADALVARMADALAGGCDVLLSTGGVSVGDRDHARDAFARVGGVLRFWRVRMRPGGPLAYGVARLPAAGGVPARDVPWLGLPGNPVSAMVTFELFARPLLLRLAGRTHVHRRPVPVLLDEPVSTAAPLTHFLRAVVHRDAAGALRARLAGPQGSGLLTSMARADALLVVPDDVRDVPAGATLPALSLTAALPDGGGAGLDELTAEWPL
jgi:molybdopterin molybdotransferase